MSSTSRRLLITAAVALVAVAFAQPAASWEYTIVNGQAGHVTAPPVFPFEDGRFTTWGPFLMMTTFDGPYVWRSPATNGQQLVQAVYTVQRHNGNSWYTASRQNTQPFIIPAGAQGVYLPRLWRSPGTNVLYNRGYFRVQWNVAWVCCNGVDLGSTVISPSQVGDLRCRQMLRPCHATERWVRLGRAFAQGGGW
jgi:hypothetical protein